MAPLTRWHTARASGSARWLALGDSFTEGQGASSRTLRYVERALAGLDPTAGPGYLPAWFATYGPDSTWTSHSALTGTLTHTEPKDTLGRRRGDLAASSSVTFTVTGSEARVWWVGGAGTFTVSVDGGAAVPVDTASATGPQVTAVTLGAAGNHTVRLATGAGQTARIGGVEAGTPTGVRLLDGAHGGYRSPDYLDMAAVWALADPDLVTICLGINDFLHNSSTAEQVKGNVQALVGQLRAATTNPSITIIVPPPLTPAPAQGQQPWSVYTAAIASVATDDPTLGLIDLTSMGGSSGPLYRSDNLHPSDAGHAEIGSRLHAYLSAPAATGVRARVPGGDWASVTVRARTAGGQWTPVQIA